MSDISSKQFDNLVRILSDINKSVILLTAEVQLFRKQEQMNKKPEQPQVPQPQG